MLVYEKIFGFLSVIDETISKFYKVVAILVLHSFYVNVI